MRVSALFVLFALLAVTVTFAEETTAVPTVDTTVAPTEDTTVAPTVDTTAAPTVDTTVDTTVAPTEDTTDAPTVDTTAAPTADTTADTTAAPTVDTTAAPTEETTADTTAAPTVATSAPKSSSSSSINKPSTATSSTSSVDTTTETSEETAEDIPFSSFGPTGTETKGSLQFEGDVTEQQVKDAVVSALGTSPDRVRIDKITPSGSKRDTTKVDFTILEEDGAPSSVILMKTLQDKIAANPAVLGTPVALTVVSVNYNAEYSTFGLTSGTGSKANITGGAVSVGVAVATIASLFVMAL